MMRHGQSGIALVLVLWVLVLLSVIAGSMVATQRAGLSMLSNIKDERQGRALVAAGINYMLLRLEKAQAPSEDNPFPVDGQLHPWEFAGETIWIGAMPESGRIDINLADDQMLLKLMTTAGLDEVEATAARDAILDWRDEDNARHAEGAEDDDYEAEGRVLGARDGPFLTIEELQQVMGITPQAYRALEPLISVHSGQKAVNPAVAADGVLLSVPGMTLDDLESYKLLREQALAQGLPVPSPVGAGAGYFATGQGNVYRVYAELDRPGDRQIQGEVVVDIQRRTTKGYVILEKRYTPLSTLGRVLSDDEQS